MKIIFGTADNLPLNNSLKLRMLTIIVRSVFKDDETFIHKFIQMSVCMCYKNGNKHKINEN